MKNFFVFRGDSILGFLEVVDGVVVEVVDDCY